MVSIMCKRVAPTASNVGVHVSLRRLCRKHVVGRAVRAGTVKAKADNGGIHTDVPQRSVVVGGGPCGLAAAMYLSQMGWPDIEVWDMLPPPQPSDDGRWGTADRSYNVIVSAKGQAALHELGAYNRVIKCSAPSNYRQEWTPERPEGKLTVYTDDDQNPTPQVIQRDRLVACMLEHIEKEHAGRVRVRHNIQLQELAVQDDGKVSLKWSQGAPPATDGTAPQVQADMEFTGTAQTEFVVGADGTNSVVRKLLTEHGLGSVQNVSLEEKRKNTRVYKNITIPVQHTQYSAPDGGGICRLAERSAAGRVLESLPTREGNQLALVLYNVDDEEVESIATEEQAAAFLKTEFPNIYPLIPHSEVKAFLQRPASKLPKFQYAWPDLHYSNSVVLAGDAIHTVKPYFGLGVNSALDDVRWLHQCLTQHPGDRASALELYSGERALDAQALVVESHKADQSLWNLVFPIIMDSAFNKLFPGLFRGSLFKSMELEGLRFNDARRRKRLDRIVQFSMIGIMLAAIGAAVIYRCAGYCPPTL